VVVLLVKHLVVVSERNDREGLVVVVCGCSLRETLSGRFRTKRERGVGGGGVCGCSLRERLRDRFTHILEYELFSLLNFLLF